MNHVLFSLDLFLFRHLFLIGLLIAGYFLFQRLFQESGTNDPHNRSS